MWFRFPVQEERATKCEADGHDPLFSAFRLLDSQEQVVEINVLLPDVGDFINPHPGVEDHESRRVVSGLQPLRDTAQTP
jgi:hypothetical protein